MTYTSQKHSNAWLAFSFAAFGIAAAMMAGGIYFLEASFSAKGFYAMSALMLVHTTLTLSKTMRDNEEADRLINKMEDAQTEKLLKEMHDTQEGQI